MNPHSEKTISFVDPRLYRDMQLHILCMYTHAGKQKGDGGSKKQTNKQTGKTGWGERGKSMRRK